MTLEELEAVTADQPVTAEQAAIILLQCMSPLFGMKQTSQCALRMSAFGGKADMANKFIRLSVIATARIRPHEMDS